MFQLPDTPCGKHTAPNFFENFFMNSLLSFFAEAHESKDNANKMKDVTAMVENGAHKGHGFSLPVVRNFTCLFDVLMWIPLLSTLLCLSRQRTASQIVLLEPP